METKLITLAQLLMLGHKPPVLATAIEKHGLAGWDAYGRWGQFKKTHAATQLALNDLHRVHYEMVRCNSSEPPTSWHSAISGADFPKPIHHLGWIEGKLPDFEKINSSFGSQPSFVTPKASEIRVETAHAIIGGMLQLLIGEIPHPEIRTTLLQSDVVNALLEEFHEFEGISESTLKARFAQANHLVRKVKP